MKKHRAYLFICPIFIVALITLNGCGDKGTDSEKDKAFAEIIESIQAEYDLPAFAGAIISSDSIQCAVVGLRKLGGSDSVTLTDKWQIGSNTKALTASLIAILVEEGLLEWTSTPLEIFPQLADSIHDDLKSITLTQLLSHRAGIQPYTEADEFEDLPELTGTPLQQRRAFAAYLLNQGPFSDIGEYAYSNAGYGLAAAMAEQAADESWESLIQTRLLTPLGIEITFGWPAHDDPNQPWGHWDLGNGLEPHDPLDEYQLPSIIAPAGSICISIEDYARFLQWQLCGLQGQDSIISAESFDILHDPIGDYALGWAVQPHKGVITSMHDGSAGTFLCLAIVQAGVDRAIALITNCDSQQSQQAIFKAIDELTD